MKVQVLTHTNIGQIIWYKYASNQRKNNIFIMLYTSDTFNDF